MKLNLKDKIVGRPIRCNKQKLNPKKDTKYAEVVFVGDVHYGSPQCNLKKFLEQLDYCLKHKIYVFLMGDLLEMATRTSVGAGIYEQETIGQSQYEKMVGFLHPLADKKLILGMHAGNHEDRVYQATGIDISKAMAKELEIPYLGNACWNEFRVGKQSYSIYSLHGRTGSRFDGTALTALERLSAAFSCDLVAMGHAHKCVNSSVIYQKLLNGVIKEMKKYLLITGHFLKYDGGYGQTIGLPMSKLGSPKVKFFEDHHNLHISW